MTGRRVRLAAALALIAGVYACSVYANLSFAVTSPADYRFFPPFRPNVNANLNADLAAENFNIARSLVAGEGFAAPFPGSSGPTAWMPPGLPAVEAALLWASGGSRDGVMAAVVFLQVNVLIATGLLVLALARRTALALAVFATLLLCHFHLCFQLTQDCWLVLLAVDLLIAGCCWCRPLDRWRTAWAWGLFGGLCALVNPVVAFAWAAWSVLVGLRRRTWATPALALLMAGLVVAPWTMRNYLVLGRLVPVKSNLAYELYQSQCLQPDGVVRWTTFRRHPYNAATPEGQEYRQLGEAAFLDRKREQFRQAFLAHPGDFAWRVGHRFLAATLWYEPFDQADAARRPWALWLERLLHPLPFLGLVVLVFTGVRRGLHPAQWTVLGVYSLYLLPYVLVSYYDRYAVGLLGAKVLLVLWAADRSSCPPPPPPL